MNTIDKLKKAIKEKTLVIGLNSTVKSIKKKLVELVVLANNTPLHVREEIKHLSSVSEIELVEFDKSNIELGATCKKPFGVMIVSIKRGKKK